MRTRRARTGGTGKHLSLVKACARSRWPASARLAERLRRRGSWGLLVRPREQDRRAPHFVHISAARKLSHELSFVPSPPSEPPSTAKMASSKRVTNAKSGKFHQLVHKRGQVEVEKVRGAGGR